jgi:hypothetical protein
LIWSRLGSDPHAFVVILARSPARRGDGLQRYVIIIATAFAGGWTMLWAAMNVFDSSGTLRERPQVWMVYPLDLSPAAGGCRGVGGNGLLGVFTQLRFTAR